MRLDEFSLLKAHNECIFSSNVLLHRVTQSRHWNTNFIKKSTGFPHTGNFSNMAAPVIACMITCLCLTLPHLLYFKDSQPYFLGLTEQS